MQIPKYVKGDLVRLSDELPRSMSHFKGRGKLAIVMYDSKEPSEFYGEHQYGLLIKGRGLSAWYQESLIVELIEQRRLDLIEPYEKEADEENKKRHKEADEANFNYILKLYSDAAKDGATPENIDAIVTKKIEDNIDAQVKDFFKLD